MDVVVDANILFASIIKEGVTIRLIFTDELHLFAPEFLLSEFSKHREEILEKTYRSEDEFNKLIEVISRRINFVPKEEIDPFMKNAEKISPDPDDSMYFALAMRIGAAIWSNDSRLKNQNKIKVHTTSELIKMFLGDEN